MRWRCLTLDDFRASLYMLAAWLDMTAFRAWLMEPAS